MVEFKAFEMLKNASKIDILFSDIRMPNGSGIDLVKNVSLLPDSKKPKLFLYSAYSDNTDDDYSTLGVLYRFKKPFKWDNLIEIMTQNVAN